MAHGLTFLDRDMAYSGNKGTKLEPWHKGGEPMGDGLFTSDDVLNNPKCSHIFNDVNKVPLYIASGDTYIPVPDKFATIRLDAEGNLVTLGTVGNNYTVVQNLQVAKLLETFAKFTTMGVLYNGRTFWATIELGEFDVVKGDTTKLYLVARTSHDGSTYLDYFRTSVRTVCANTLNMGLADAKGNIKKRKHTTNVGDMFAADYVEKLRADLGVHKASVEADKALFTALANTKVSDAQVEVVFKALFGEKPEEAGKGQTYWFNRGEKFAELLESGMGANIKGVQGTAWGLLNACTEYYDHHAQRCIKIDDAQDVNMESVLWGKLAESKDKALATIQQVCLA